MVKCVAKLLLVNLFQMGLLYAGLSGVSLCFPLPRPDIGWGIQLYHFFFYIYPVMLIGIDVAFLFIKKRMLPFSLVFIVTDLLYWFPSFSCYPYRAPVIFVGSLVILFLGGIFVWRVTKDFFDRKERSTTATRS